MADTLPIGDGKPFQPEGWGVWMGTRNFIPGAEAVALPPNSFRWVRNVAPKEARLWITRHGPRDATPEELAKLAAFLDDSAKATVAADRAMAGYGTGCV